MCEMRSVLAVTVAIVALPSMAMAERVVPPGNSAVNQYTETYPTAAGGATGGDKGKRPPAEVLGERNAQRLEVLGPEGRAAAALAATTAPAGGAAEDRSRKGGDERGAKDAADSAPRTAAPGGSSALGEVIGQATGTSSPGGIGWLTPLIILAAVSGALAYRWRRKQPAS